MTCPHIRSYSHLVIYLVDEDTSVRFDLALKTGSFFSYSTETTSSQLSSELLVTGSITPSSTADGSTYSTDMSFVSLSHPASVMGTTEMLSLAQSSGLTQASQRKAIGKPLETQLLCI